MAIKATGPLSSKVVLLIEDNEDDERLTLRALRRNNVMNEVVVACDGQEALDYLFAQGKYAGRSASDVPEVIVLDLNLPKVTGLEVLERIRSNPETKPIPVVVLTSSADMAQIERSYLAGANSYVQKPSDPNEFSDVVLQIAMYWLLLNRNAAIPTKVFHPTWRRVFLSVRATVVSGEAPRVAIPARNRSRRLRVRSQVTSRAMEG